MKVLLLNRVKNIVAKGEIACFEQFFLLPQGFQKFKSHLLQMRQNAFASGKGLNLSHLQIHFDTYAAGTFFKHYDKKEIVH